MLRVALDGIGITPADGGREGEDSDDVAGTATDGRGPAVAFNGILTMMAVQLQGIFDTYIQEERS